MFFLEELIKIQQDYKDKKISIFIDMDGVVADYRFGEGENIKNNISGTYINKRPIHTVINNLKTINDKVDCKMYILSSCLFIEQANEKVDWLDKYMNFIKKENRIFTISDTFENRKMLKINKIRERINCGDCDIAILIDDTHDILFLALKELNEKVIPFHVITLID